MIPFLCSLIDVAQCFSRFISMRVPFPSLFLWTPWLCHHVAWPLASIHTAAADTDLQYETQRPMILSLHLSFPLLWLKCHVNMRRHNLLQSFGFSSVWGNYFIEALHVPFIWLISTFPGVLLSDRCYRWVAWDAWKGKACSLYPKIIGTTCMIWELHNT